MTYLTPRDVDNFGSEFIDVAQRAAMHTMSPELERLHDENAQLMTFLMMIPYSSRAGTTQTNLTKCVPARGRSIYISSSVGRVMSRDGAARGEAGRGRTWLRSRPPMPSG